MRVLNKLTDRWLSIVLGFAVLLILVPQAARHPTLEGDALEIVAAIVTGGVIHSPGFPAYTILAHLFQKTLLFLSPSFAITLLSLFCAAASTSTVFLICRHFNIRRCVSTVFSLLPLFALEVWYQSLIVELYSFAILWMLLIVLVCLRLQLQYSKWQWFQVSFLIFGGFGSHLYVWPMIPLAILFIATLVIRSKITICFVPAICGGIVGLSTFLYFPVQANHSTYVDEGRIVSWDRFVDHVTWKLHRERLETYEQDAKNNIADWVSVKLEQLKYFAGQLSLQYNGFLNVLLVILVALIVLPLTPHSLLVRGPPSLWHHGFSIFSVLLFLNIWIVFAGSKYEPSVLSEMTVHFVPIFYFFSIWMALGLNLFKNPRVSQVASLCVGLLLLLHVTKSYSQLNIRNNDLAIVHGRELLRDLPPNTILMSQGDVDLMSVIYQQAVLEYRKDVQLVNLVNGTQWYFDHLKKNVTSVRWPFSYSKYFQLEVIEQNIGKYPIYFSNFYAALLVIQQPSMKGRFVVVPENGGYQLVDKRSMFEKPLNSKKVVFSNFYPESRKSFRLSDVEVDLAGHYMDYYGHRIEYLSVFQKPRLAREEFQLGMAQPIGDSQFNRLMHQQLIDKAEKFQIVQ